jgi:hypothetical protein
MRVLPGNRSSKRRLLSSASRCTIFLKRRPCRTPHSRWQKMLRPRSRQQCGAQPLAQQTKPASQQLPKQHSPDRKAPEQFAPQDPQWFPSDCRSTQVLLQQVWVGSWQTLPHAPQSVLEDVKSAQPSGQQTAPGLQVVQVPLQQEEPLGHEIGTQLLF